MSYRNIRQGCDKPVKLGAKASLNDGVIGAFCAVIIPDFGRGAVGYIIRETEKPQNQLA